MNEFPISKSSSSASGTQKIAHEQSLRVEFLQKIGPSVRSQAKESRLTDIIRYPPLRQHPKHLERDSMAPGSLGSEKTAKQIRLTG